jgi:hypothetical protein
MMTLILRSFCRLMRSMFSVLIPPTRSPKCCPTWVWSASVLSQGVDKA